MPCEHPDSCLVCLQEELARVRAHRDELLAGVQALLVRVASKPQHPSGAQTSLTPALTPPDSPSRKEKAEKALQLASGERFGASSPAQEPDLANLDPLRHKSASPDAGSDEPKPTAPYSNPWKDIDSRIQSTEIAVGMITEVANATAKQKRRSKPKPAPKPAPPGKKTSKSPRQTGKKTPAGIKKPSKNSRASIKATPKDKTALLTVAQVEKLTGRSSHLIQTDCRKGEVPSIRGYNGQVLIRYVDFQKYQDTLTKKAKTKGT